MNLPKVKCCYNCASCSEKALSVVTCDKNGRRIGDPYREVCFGFVLLEQDQYLEEHWKDLEDTTFVEDEQGNLVLLSKWWLFEAGTPREEIWRYFDQLYPGGVAMLMEKVS